MPTELREHLRYPEDLFRVQTDLYSKYQLAPENFFQREGAWSVAQAPNVAPRIATSSTLRRPGGRDRGDRVRDRITGRSVRAVLHASSATA